MTETRQTIGDLLAASRDSLDRLTPADADVEARAGALLIDTRCREQLVADGAIPGAIHVPLSVLYWRLDPASGHDDPRLSAGYPDRRVILVCAHGYSSSIAAATLRQLGFRRATDVIGGFEGWKRDGLPVETTT
jgi:rhodanese-related sulfurtransferase